MFGQLLPAMSKNGVTDSKLNKVTKVKSRLVDLK